MRERVVVDTIQYIQLDECVGHFLDYFKILPIHHMFFPPPLSP